MEYYLYTNDKFSGKFISREKAEKAAANISRHSKKDGFELRFLIKEEHNKDEECTVDESTLCCSKCGVDHSGECPICGGHGFHKTGCEGIEL